ncbi:MAG: hypothetical protein NUW02_03760 [Candidatus Campbellbacteria bacterium]|nr:hypothetical protein [Candidatus Campbellbacteria bacterium]
MSNLMKVAIAFFTVAFVLFGVAGIFVLQNADARVEEEQIGKQLPVPHDGSSIFGFSLCSGVFIAVGLILVVSATTKPLPKSAFGKM